MTDFEVFKANWDRAVNALVGRITQTDQGVYSREDLNTMWQDELLSRRFCSIGLRDEAQVFLEDLFARRPDTAQQVMSKLQSSRLKVGVDMKSTFIKGAAAVGSALMANSLWNSKAAKAAKVVGTTLAGGTAACLTGSVAIGLGSATKGAIIQEVRNETDKQLEEFRAILED